MTSRRSAVWGGATLGLLLGLLLGVLTGHLGSWVLFGVLVGLGLGIASNLLAYAGLLLGRLSPFHSTQVLTTRESIVKAMINQGLTKAEAEFEVSERERVGEEILRAGTNAKDAFERAREIAYAPMPLFVRKDHSE